MPECSTRSTLTVKLFDHSDETSKVNSFQPHTPVARAYQANSELSCLADSQPSLDDWSTSSYPINTEAYSVSSDNENMRVTSSPINNIQNIPDSDNLVDLRFAKPSESIHNMIDNDNTSVNTQENNDSNAAFYMPQVSIPSTKASESVSNVQDIGYIRLLVCGDSGIGKTSLVNMFLNAPEITKVQTFPSKIEEPSSFFSGVETSSKEEGVSEDSDYEFEGMKEIFATTSQDGPLSDDHDDGDLPIVSPEYNICAIDTVGYGAYLDAGAIMSSVTSYLEHQFQITNSIFSPMQANNDTLIKILNNSHGAYTHVDACLYLIYNRIKPVDIEYMRSLQHLCNIVPVVVKQASYNSEQMNKRKYESLKELMDHDIDIFGFGHCKEELLEMCRRGNPGVPPFVVSFDNTEDHMNGAKSLDFKSLKDMLFYKECSNLRSSTAQKFSKWRAAQFLHRGHNNDTFGEDLIPLREYPTIISSTLTTAETVDRMERVKQAEVKKVNLHIARFISERRKEMEERMRDQEQQLKKEFVTSSYKRRARILITELAKLLIQSPGEQTQLMANLPGQQITNKKKKPSQTPFHLIILKKLQAVPPEASKLIAACALLLLPFHFGPLVFFLSFCLFHCLP